MQSSNCHQQEHVYNNDFSSQPHYTNSQQSPSSSPSVRQPDMSSKLLFIII